MSAKLEQACRLQRSAAAASPSRAESPSSRYVWYVIFLLTVVNVFNYMDRMALSVLLPLIKKDLQLSDAQLGLLVGFAFALFYAIWGIPIARWADRGIRRNIIAITLTMWSLMTALCGAAQNFWHFFAARMGVGVGEAGGLPPAQSILCDYVPLRRRSGMFAIHSVGLVVGMMLGMALAGWLGETIGWRWTFAALGLPGVAVAIVVRLTLREPARGILDRWPEGKTENSSGTIAFLAHCKTYVWLTSFLAVNGFVQSGLYQWWPSFYARLSDLDMASVGVYVGFALGAGQTIGMLAGGFIANKAAQRNVKLPLIIGAMAMALAIPSAVGTLFVSSNFFSFFLVFLTGMFWTVQAGPVVAAIYSVVKPEMRATSGAVNLFFTSVVGLGFAPFIVGLLSDLLSPSLGRDSLRYALLAPVCLLPLSVFALRAAAKTISTDLGRATAPI